jgi:transposase
MRSRPKTQSIELSIDEGQRFRFINHQMTRNQSMKEQEAYGAFIGMDWGDSSHAVSLREAREGAPLEQESIASSPEAVFAWLAALGRRFAGRRVALGIELSRGALVEELATCDWIDLYMINPATSAGYRKTFVPSGAKDDLPDSAWCLELVSEHRDKLRRWRPASPCDRKLQLLCERRRKLVSAQVDLRNELNAQLKEYFPQALEVAGNDLASAMACRFLLRWPDLKTLQRARLETVRKFYYAQGCRRGDVIEARLQRMKEALAVSEDEALVEPGVLMVQALARQLLALDQAIKGFNHEIARCFSHHGDAGIWTSFPGAGQTLAPRLAVAWGEDRERFEDASQMQMYSGSAPVRRRSGKKDRVHRRYCRPLFLHQTFWEYANHSVLHCAWARDYVAGQKARGKKHSTAVRALAFKWQRIMFRCWKDRRPYDESIYLKALEKAGSPYSGRSTSQAA